MVCILVIIGDFPTLIENNMKKVGLIGEAPNDTDALINLLSPIYKESVNFITLINDIHGSMLEYQKTKHLLRKEYESHNPHAVIFIRDLDALESNTVEKDNRKKYFTDYNSVVDKRGIFLLNIYELEALILADIITFNEEYETSIVYDGDPMHQEQPKEFLINNSKHPKKYIDSDNPSLFSRLNFERLKNCKYFAEFLKDFDRIIAS